MPVPRDPVASRSNPKRPRFSEYRVSLGLALFGLAVVVGLFAGLIQGPLAAVSFTLSLGLILGLVLSEKWLALPLTAFLLVMPSLLTEIVGGVQVVQVLGFATVGGTLLAVLVGDRSFTWSPVLSGAAVFLAGVILSTILARDPILSARSASGYVLGFGLAFAVVQAVRRTSDLTWLLRAWVVGSLFVIAPNIESPQNVRVSFGGAQVQGRLSGVFSEPNAFGEFCIMALFVAVALFLASTNRLDRIMGASLAALSVVAVAFTLSRGTWIGVAVGLLVLAVLVPRFAIVLGAIVVTVVAGLGTAIAGGQEFALAFVSRMASFSEGAENPEDLRPLIWREALAMWQDSEWVGIGLGGYKEFSRYGGSIIAPEGAFHAHNGMLNYGTETGVLGLLSLLLCIGIALYVSLKAIWGSKSTLLPKPAIASLLAAMFGIAAHGLVDYVYSNPMLLALVWILLGFLAVACKPLPPPPVVSDGEVEGLGGAVESGRVPSPDQVSVSVADRDEGEGG